MKAKPSIAIIRGKFLNQYEMQSFELLNKQYTITAFGSKTSFHDRFTFPVIKLTSPMDLPEFPYKMPFVNRVFIDAHYLVGLEGKLKGFDIAHTAETYYHYTHQALVAKKKGYVKKVVVTVWENIPCNNEGIWGRKGFKKNARENVDHFIAITEKAKNALLLEGTDPSKITVIPPGIDTKVFRPKAKLNVKKQVNNTISPIRILFVGRLEKEKGVYELLSAIHILINDKTLKGYCIDCTYVGDGSQKENLVVLARRMGIESFITYKTLSYDAMKEAYGNADIFVAPSKKNSHWQEQFGMALLEAQACGLPIVTTHSGSISENVGDAAFFVPESNDSALAYAIKKFILSPALRFTYSKKARKRAETVYGAKIIAAKIEQVYKDVLET